MNPLGIFGLFFAHLYALLFYWTVGLYKSRLGPPIVVDRLTGLVRRETETLRHRFKMYTTYNVLVEFLDRTLAVRKYLHYHSTREGKIAKRPFGPDHDPERKQISQFIKTYKIGGYA